MWRCSFVVLSLLVSLLLTPAAWSAEDVIRINIRQSALDQRGGYKEVLLRAVLDRTVADFGPYRIDTSIEKVPRKRALLLMEHGEVFNTYIAPADPAWEQRTLPIRIPIRRGLLNYRLLLTTDKYQDALSQVQTAEQLMRFRLGLRSQWTTTKAMKALGFDVVEAVDYDGLFQMLSHDRFDYVPRGVNEIFAELAVRQEKLSNLRIEPQLALYLPMPVYFYVSPKHPRLEARIRIGFERLIADGGFNQLFEQHFGEQVAAAKLSQRRIIQLGNPLLSDKTPFEREELWFYPIKRQQ